MSFREQYPNLEEDIVAPGPTDTELAELRAEVRRLRTREAALVAAITGLYTAMARPSGHKSLEALIDYLNERGRQQSRKNPDATWVFEVPLVPLLHLFVVLAADPSAPATTEERP